MVLEIEKGYLYKVKEYPFLKGDYTIFCPKLTRNVITEDYFRGVPFLFAIYGNGKGACISIQEMGVENQVRIINGKYVKKLTAKDYMKVSRLLKKKGYAFDKKARKLINLNL